MFGGKKKDKKNGDVVAERLTVKTGGHVDEIYVKLLQCAHDSDEAARVSIASSLREIGANQPIFALTQAIDFVRIKKPDHSHRVTVLRLIGDIIDSNGKVIPHEMSKQFVKFACSEMIFKAENVLQTDIQGAASRIMIGLAHHFPMDVIDALIEKWPTGEVPHYYVIKTLSDFAEKNPVKLTLRLKEVLERVGPVLGGIKKDRARFMFTTALGHFGEAVQAFKAEASEEELAKVSPNDFKSPFASSFLMIFNTWRQSKNPKIRLAIAEALGQMAPTMDPERFKTVLPQLLPAYLAMYKKEEFNNHLSITQGLYSIVECLIRDESNKNGFEDWSLAFTQLLMTIHPLTAREPDYKNPQTSKNHNCLLRTYEILARTYRRETLTHVLNLLQSEKPGTRMGSLLILRHLVNSLDDILSDDKPLLISSLQVLMKESDLKVKKAFIRLIVAMADNGYLTLEGGQNLVMFILRQCAISDNTIKEYQQRMAAADAKRKKNNKKGGGAPEDRVTPQQLRGAGDQIMNILCTKVPSTHSVMWPYLFEFVVNPPYTPALLTITRSITQLGAQKIEQKSDDFNVDWKKEVNLPKPQAVFSRLMVMLNVPFDRPKLGVEIVRCLAVIARIIHPNLQNLFAEHTPALKKFIEESSPTTLNKQKWEDTLLRLFKEAAGLIQNEEWLAELGEALVAQWKFYQDRPQLKRVIHRFLGTVLHRAKHKGFINTNIDHMLNHVTNEIELERSGCAQGLGLASQAHFDVVLERLTHHLQKLSVPKKKKSLFSFGSSSKEKTSGSSAATRCTITLSWGFAVAYAPSELVVSRIEAHVLSHLCPILHGAKNPQLRECVIRAIDMLGKALHPVRLGSTYILKERDELIRGMLKYLEDGNLQLKVFAINALSTLASLSPALTESQEIRQQILDKTFPHIELASDEKTLEDPAQDAKRKQTISQVLSNLSLLCAALVNMEPTVPSLSQILTKLEFYVVSKKAQERQAAISTYLVVLKKFMSKLTADGVRQPEKSLTHLGHFVAFMIPRCLDSTAKIRQTSIENLQALLYIDQLLREPSNVAPASELKMFTPLKNNMADANFDKRMLIAGEMANILAAVIKIEDMPELLQDLLKGANDPDGEAALGVTQVYRGLLVNRNAELKDDVRTIVDETIKAVEILGTSNAKVLEESLQGMVILTESHFDEVLRQLFEHKHPVKDAVRQIFLTLGNAEQISIMLVEHLLHVINDTPLLEDEPTPDIMVATSALAALFSLRRIKELVPKYYAPMFGALLTRMGTAVGADAGESSDEAVAAFQAFLAAADEEKVLQTLADRGAWGQLKSPSYEEGAHTVTEVMSKHRPEKKRDIFNAMVPFLSKHYVGHRVMGAAVIAQFVQQSPEDTAVLQQAIKQLLPRVTDQHERVRIQGLRGLGFLNGVWNDELKPAASSVLSALTMAMEDQIDTVASASVESLCQVLEVLDDDVVSAMLINICFRMRPAFDRFEPSIRIATFELFSALCKFGTGASAENFEEQVHTNLPTYIIHVNDEDGKVSEKCIESFILVSELMGVPPLTELLKQTTAHTDFETFLQKLCPILVSYFPVRLTAYLQRATQYFKSSSNSIKANAAMFAALTIAAIPERKRRTVDVGGIVRELLELMTCPSPVVRVRVARALSNLSTI